MGWLLRSVFLCFNFSFIRTSIETCHFQQLSVVENPYVNNKFLQRFTRVSKAKCASVCYRDRFCLSFYYSEVAKICLTNPFVILEAERTFYHVDSGVFRYYEKKILKKPESCSEIKQAQPEADDGHYWIYPQSPLVYGNRLKVYCYSMSEASPVEYVSLPQPNVGVFPPLQNIDCTEEAPLEGNFVGTTTFNKIRVKPEVMLCDNKDYTFANWTGQRYPYGETGDCYTAQAKYNRSACGPVGTFNVDLTGTGIMVHPQTRYGYKETTFFTNVIQTMGKFTLYCGGLCGYCWVNAPGIILNIDRSDWVELESAVLVEING